MEDEIHILIVEDEALIAQNIKAMLQEFGYDVTGVYYKYHTAVQAIADTVFDILITDINLGHGIYDKSGLQLAELVKQSKNCPVIFLTAFSDKDTIKKAAALSPSAYLVKPVNAATLFASLQLALNNFSTSKEPVTDTEEIPDYFFIKHGSKLVKIFWKDVYHMESTKNYVKVSTTGQSVAVLVRDSLKGVLQDMVPEAYKSSFIKISRSEVIAKKFILKADKEFVETAYGKYKVGGDVDIRKEL